MEPSTALSALLFACFVNLASAADDHKDHAHKEKPGQAHTHDAKPQHGGVVSVIKDINYELVAKADSLTLYVTDHDQPVDTQNASATITLLSASDKTEAKLLPAGSNQLRAQGAFKIQAATKAVAIVKLGDKPGQSVRFVLN
ncbi:hypothetical protein GBK02_14155 [Dechloromonas sp. TW-R-39-2]|uniref:hypothetical protein n=1 Tax=Dechloromonas sp. TW-R-39-2 TaxID=2654218 RepID=UPI00193E0C20|nr:hypothetical protein [Dechloromonas sp. TW-R-39-2]QRM20445.1 hypothetical protein GBK02_14155 [Dechloromonas sp. TW-R-39-2]